LRTETWRMFCCALRLLAAVAGKASVLGFLRKIPARSLRVGRRDADVTRSAAAREGRMPVSRANGVDIYYEKAGAGPALVLLHPIPYDHSCWLYQVAHFSSRYTTLAIDLRCWGRSGKPTGAFSARDLCDDIMGVLVDEGFKTAIVMGCSFGSKIALTLSIDHPDVFEATILAGGNSGFQHYLEPHIPFWREHAAAGTMADGHRIALLRGVTNWWAETPIGRYMIDGFVERGKAIEAESSIRMFEALINLDLTQHLASFRRPILIINGEHDSAFAGGERTASLIPHAERKILAGLGHCSFLEGPAQYDAAVEEFLLKNNLWPSAA
jgi:pimeloyl-ACP methyl ester carboxylesterase